MKVLTPIQRNAAPLVGAVVLGTAFVLLLLSSDTGKERYDNASHELDRVEAVNARLDAALLALRFGLHTDFDLVTDLQHELQLASAGLRRPVPGGNGASVELMVEQKLESIEEFKAQQAIVRNSIAISEEMLKELWAQEVRDNDAKPNAATLIEMERALLRYVSEGDYSSGQSLEAKMAAAERERPDLTSVEEWGLLVAHVKNLLQRRADLESLLNGLFAVPLAETAAAERRAAESTYAASAATAGRYRVALFAVAVLLLAFSTWKVAQVRGYMRLIESSNAKLEEHVAERTKELRESNVSLHREIREREEVEAQLRLAQKLESIGQLAAGIAHEINTPVQYVSDNLAFLAASWQDMQPLIDDYNASLQHADARRLEIWNKADMDFVRAELPVALEAAGVGLKHISRIVLAMKEFSHPGSEDLQSADINRAIETTITIAKNEWKYVAQLHTDFGTLPTVLCNVSSFNQVMLNLIVNAAQAIGERVRDKELGNIWIKTSRLPAHVEIRVEDDGPGVPAAIREQIFDPFFTTKEVGKGTGQGLSIAYRVVCQQHGGTLAVEPRTGGGACFVIRLPVPPAEPAASTQSGLTRESVFERRGAA